MKRIAKRNIQEDMYIEYGQSNRVYNFAPRVCDRNGNLIGYVTDTDFQTMIRDKQIVKVLGDYWYARYMLAKHN